LWTDAISAKYLSKGEANHLGFTKPSSCYHNAIIRLK